MATQNAINIPLNLTVAVGGTSATSLTSHTVLSGNTTSAITQLAVGTSGQLLLGASGADAKFATITSSAGSITYTTGVNSLNLDLLNYAAGSFTPTIAFVGGSSGILYASQIGSYLRIANIVFINISVVLTSKGVSTGGVQVLGIPYVPNTNPGQLNIIGQNLTYTGQIICSSNNAGNDLLIQMIVSGGGVNSLTDTAFADNSSFNITGMYFI